jgi:ribosomal protein S18 acetylase RimI-like enzyme
MDIRTLEHVPLPVITATFNEAFSDYFIRLQFNEQAMAAKIKAEGILLPFSIGAFEQERLVGFILHGYDPVHGMKTIYNAGTGVIPFFRGKGITAAMYRYAIPMLLKKGIHEHVLEVIDKNLPAISIYEKTGFKKTRDLAVFKSTAAIKGGTGLRLLTIRDTTGGAAGFGAMAPTWQNNLAALERDKEQHQLLGAFEEGKMVGYAAWVPASGRIRQCAIDPHCRRKGYGSALFSHMMNNSSGGELSVVNVDEAYGEGIAFLTALQFKKILGLREMKLEVSPQLPACGPSN